MVKLSVSPTSLQVQGTVGTAAPSASVQVKRQGGGGPLKWTTTAPLVNWFTVSPSSGTNNSTLTVTFRTTALPAGTYTAGFDVVSGAQRVPVSMEVTLTAAVPVPPDPIPPDPIPPTSGYGPQASIACS